MTQIKGVTVILINKKKIGEDPFGKAIFKDVEIAVENVLIAPTLSDDIVNQHSLTGKTAVYTLAIPKGDNNIWKDQEVRFFGDRWKVFGDPLKGLDHLIPLEWNMKVTVERYE